MTEGGSCAVGNRNTNCLDGLRCPECGSYQPFIISAYTYVEMWDSGSETIGDIEWDNDSFCKCVMCGLEGTVKEFDEVNYGQGNKEDEEEE